MASLKSIFDFYENSVKEADEKGFSELYKRATERFFKEVEDKESLNYNGCIPLTVIDVEYRNGYYIFGMGSNSVVHFHIKECPGWKFGIWWGEPTLNDKEEITKLGGQVFFQYEDEIDKFKPAASDFCFNLYYYPNNCDQMSEWPTIKSINYVRKYPIHAWAKHYCGYDYNYEYIPTIRIFWEYAKYRFRKTKDKIIFNYLDRSVIRYIEKHIIPTIYEGEAFIHDCGEYCSPRYDIQCKVPDDTPDEDVGCFGLDDKGLDKLLKRNQKIAKRLAFKYYFNPVHNDITFYRGKDFPKE